MKVIAVIPFLFLFLGCAPEPEALKFGVDFCHTCKMTLMDKKFGGEIVTQKGKVYKFDDIKCMIDFYNSGYELHDQMLFKLVVDYSNPENLIEAQEAYYVKSDQIRSPMAGEVAAFNMKETMDLRKKEWKGIWLSWGELVTEFK